MGRYLEYGIRRCIYYQRTGLLMLLTVIPYDIGTGVGFITKYLSADPFFICLYKLFRESVRECIWCVALERWVSNNRWSSMKSSEAVVVKQIVVFSVLVVVLGFLYG